MSKQSSTEILRRHAVHYARRRTSYLFNQSEQIRLATATYFSRAWHRFCVFPRARRHRLHTFPHLATYDWFFVLLACVVLRRLPRCGWKMETISKSSTLNVEFIVLFSTTSTKAVTERRIFIFSLYTAFCSRMINVHHVSY